jgi:hypothetical protein
MKVFKSAAVVAKLFLESKAITFHTQNVKTRNSGKVTPIDFNIKILLEESSVRSRFKELLIIFYDELLLSNSLHNIVNIIAINQSGMYPATILADNYNLPLFAKKDANASASNDLLVVDIISHGKTIKNIHSSVLTCFTYNLIKRDNIFVFCDFNTVIATAFEDKYINCQEHSSLLSWQQNPRNWVQNYLTINML